VAEKGNDEMKPVDPNYVLRGHSVGILLATVLAAGTLLPVGAAAEVKEAAAMTEAPAGAAKITKEVATQNALNALPGTVTDVTVEKKRGKNVWIIEIVADKDGAETDVLVDMNTGAVIGMDH
jgi:uncharacterized membrane protein YkoI